MNISDAVVMRLRLQRNALDIAIAEKLGGGNQRFEPLMRFLVQTGIQCNPTKLTNAIFGEAEIQCNPTKLSKSDHKLLKM